MIISLDEPIEASAGDAVEVREWNAELTETVEEVSDDALMEADEFPPDPSYAYTAFPSYFMAPTLAPAFIPSAAVFARI